jgi:hypothetical protein
VGLAEALVLAEDVLGPGVEREVHGASVQHRRCVSDQHFASDQVDDLQRPVTHAV